MPQSTNVRPSTENGYSFPFKGSFPSPQVTPLPAAIEELEMVTFPEGVAFSAATAWLANAATKKNKASLVNVRSLFIYASPFMSTALRRPYMDPSRLYIGLWSNTGKKSFSGRNLKNPMLTPKWIRDATCFRLGARYILRIPPKL